MFETDMDPEMFLDTCLTHTDLMVLRNLSQDIDSFKSNTQSKNLYYGDDIAIIKTLEALNSPSHDDFEPTVFLTWDIKEFKNNTLFYRYILHPYINHARKIVRVETDVVMLTHLLLYFATSIPSAIFLYYHFSWTHGFLHWFMQSYYAGAYSIMMHQHIHMGGILSKNYWWFDEIFPYIMDPLMGHSWNLYYYHHIKHHHVEGNGPDDLSSTIRYQRDSLVDFLFYAGRFIFFNWLDLPLYFLRKKKLVFAIKSALWEIAYCAGIYLLLTLVHWKATIFIFVLPVLELRAGIMIVNWAQHAFVDEFDPNSDLRSSITLIDAVSNRFGFNDGYHTSHHLNPRRHWREHPVAFIKQKKRYSNENALVFCNIGYVMITVKLLQKDYTYLAKRLIPIGEQIGMDLEQRIKMLQTKTHRFTESEIKQKFRRRHNL